MVRAGGEEKIGDVDLFPNVWLVIRLLSWSYEFKIPDLVVNGIAVLDLAIAQDA